MLLFVVKLLIYQKIYLKYNHREYEIKNN